MWWKILLLPAMSTVIVASFITTAPQQDIGESSRIFYYHIPPAWISVLAFAMSMVYSIKYLRTRLAIYDDKAVNAARLGLLFCILATVTGAIFARVAWGSFWNWDPRETSIFVLLLIYGAYFALRGAVEVEEKRAALAAVYSVFAFITVPLLVFILPRTLPSLHPSDSVIDAGASLTMGLQVRWIFFSSLVLFTILYLWMFNLVGRVQRLARGRAEAEE